ncbi:type II toxin-antitoxin system RelE/ParE family toxin [Acetobacterium sp.]|uniref:type II toxin-antitoxin system RelE/ParE family toxin n=1 Tax=Acetobacterium sp. TaxID=1872094 RepID=UPI002F41BA13
MYNEYVIINANEDDTFILLHYFHKKTQKTPVKEIAKAKLLMKDFKERTCK